MQHFTQSDDHPLRSSNANRRAGLFVLCLLLTLLLAACTPITDSGRKIESAVSGSGSVSPKDVASEILWDKWSVPHIFAQEPASAFYALGWAQTHSRGDLLLRLYAAARGRAAEFYGEDYRHSDQMVRLLGIPTLGETASSGLSAQSGRLCPWH